MTYQNYDFSFFFLFFFYSMIWFFFFFYYLQSGHEASLAGFPGGSECKVYACNARDLGLIPGLGRSPGEGNGNLFQYSCLENLMDGETW